jgi:tetratricopeptide (TPR) repeat protein
MLLTRTRRFVAPILLLLALPQFAMAQALNTDFDKEVRALMRAGETVKAEARARAELSAKKLNPNAIHWLAMLSMQKPAQREALLKDVEACIAAQPMSAICHHAQGMLYGAQAMGDGMMGAMKYVGKIRDGFTKAVESDPRWVEARRSLNQFFLMAPALMGGGAGKAFANADELAKIDAFNGALLRAEVHVHQKDYTKADALLKGLMPADADARSALAGATASIGWRLVNDKKPGDAMPYFDRAIAMDATNVQHSFGRGRVLLEQQQFDAAIAVFEGIQQKDPRYPVEFRLAAAYAGKGDKKKAVTLYEAFLKRDIVSERQRKETQEKLAALRAS